MFEDSFEKMIAQYDNAFSERKVFSGLMKDLFPREEMKANLMIMSYDLGIVDDIEKASEIDPAFAFRYVNRLQKEYGVSKENAEWAVTTWCVCYGERILQKKYDISERTGRQKYSQDRVDAPFTYQIRTESISHIDSSFGGENDLPVVLGTIASGEVVTQDSADVPHFLVCGYSGTGKTSFVQTIMTKMAIDYSPSQVKYIIYDSKSSDYLYFNHMPHLYVPVITDEKRLMSVLAWAADETKKRYKAFAENYSRDLNTYNRKSNTPLPHVFIIIDDIYGIVFQTAQYAKSVLDDLLDTMKYLLVNGRQAGMHFIIVTSTPTSKVLQKDLLANIPGRICFAVSSKADSRTVLNSNGAEGLAVPGEMIFKTPNRMVKCWAVHMTEETIANTIDALRYDYPEAGSNQSERTKGKADESSVKNIEPSRIDDDEIFPQAEQNYSNPDEQDEDIESNEEVRECVQLRPFHATTVIGGSFFVINNKIYMMKQQNTKIGNTPVSIYFDGNAIEGILYKKPKLFGTGYFQFTFNDTVDINNSKPELLNFDQENISDHTRLEFERENNAVVFSFLEQVAEDCGIDITYL